MPRTNPTRKDSPISVTHSGGWDDEQYRHEIANPRPATKSIPNRVKQLRGGVEELTFNQSESAKIDKALEKAIRDDHIKRNLRNP